MTEQTILREKHISLREQLNQAARDKRDRDVADVLPGINKFFSDLVDNLANSIEEKIEEKMARNGEDIILEAITGGPCVQFKIPDAEKVTNDEIKKMSGFIRLQEACADTAIDMKIELQSGAMQGAINIYYTQPYVQPGLGSKDVIGTTHSKLRDPTKVEGKKKFLGFSFGGS